MLVYIMQYHIDLLQILRRSLALRMDREVVQVDANKLQHRRFKPQARSQLVQRKFLEHPFELLRDFFLVRDTNMGRDMQHTVKIAVLVTAAEVAPLQDELFSRRQRYSVGNAGQEHAKYSL